MNGQISNIVSEFVNETKNLLKDNLVQEYLFGSYAKNTQNEFSDIDILIIVKQLNLLLRKEINSLASNYSLDNNIIISPVIKDLKVWEKNKKYDTLFYKEIKGYGIAL